jgi:hypothetical protein
VEPSEPRNEYAEAMRPSSPPLSSTDLALAIAGGLVAAIVGGIAWGYLVQATEMELGIAAIGIGFLAGFGVVLVTRGKRGVPLQVIAAVSAVIGVLFGKYFAFVQVGQDIFDDEIGPGAGASLSLFSGDTFSFFMDGFGDLFSPFDLLWVAFAVYTAWRIPQGQGFGRWTPGARTAGP